MKLTERKRENIIEAAIQEFQEQGFLGANVTRIAKRAEVSSRTLYRHFETKEALFDVICDIMLAKASVTEIVHYDPCRSLEEQLVESVKDYASVFAMEDYIGLKRVVFSEFLRDQERSRAFFAKTASFEYPVENLIREAMTSGKLKQGDSLYATNQLLGLVKTFLFWPALLTGSEQSEPEQIIKDSVGMFLAHYQLSPVNNDPGSC